MQAERQSEKRQLLLIDGGSVYQRLIKRLADRFELVHAKSPAEGLDFAVNSDSLYGVIVDLNQNPRPSGMLRPSLLGLWVVDQLREFATCSDIPILVVSHWQTDVIVRAATHSGIDFAGFDYEYIQMSRIDQILDFFNHESDPD